MKLPDIEWNILRGALIALGAALLVGGGAVAGSEYYLQRLETENHSYQQALNQMRNRYNTVVQELELVKQYWPQYKKLEAMGFIGDEDRLDWVDVLREAAERNRVLGLHYEVRPRAPELLDNGMSTGEFQLSGSEMWIKLNLIHEGNWLNFMRDLSRRRVGLFTVKTCSIERAQETPTFEQAATNFAAQCRLIWHTLQPQASVTEPVT